MVMVENFTATFNIILSQKDNFVGFIVENLTGTFNIFHDVWRIFRLGP